jgi:Ca2+-binding EF-hand superfamily protein
MRMRKPILNMIEWLNEKAKLEKETNPIDYATQKITGNINEYDKVIDYENLDIHNKVYQINIEIYRANNLESIPPQKNIIPYIYYKFYKQEHYSQIMNGFNPEFNDIASFTYVYTSNFHDYLEKEFLFIYLFDQTNPIKVNSDEKEVEMINDKSDCIGFCKIRLKQLMLNNEIKGEFNIISEKNMKIIGILSLCINWKVINENIIVNQLNNNTTSILIKEGIDPLLIKLAELLRKKKLTMRSSFNLFDTDNKNYVNLTDFKTHIVFTLNFTKKDDEIAKLVEIIFKGKTEVDLKDWYQVFDGLLPYDDENDKEKEIRERNNENMIDTNDNLRFSINNTKIKDGGLGNSLISKGSGDIIGQSVNLDQNFNNNNYNDNNFRAGRNNNYNYDNNNNENRIFRRNTKTIMKLINDYMINWGKSQAIDLYKMFDYDADLRVGRKEMADGFGHLGVELNNEELEMIWNEIVKGDKNMKKFDFNLFKVFYEKHRYKINDNNN